MADNLKQQLEQLKQLTAQMKEQQAALKLLNAEEEKDFAAIKRKTEALNNLEKSMDRVTGSVNESKKVVDQYNSALDETASTFGQVVPGIDKVTSALKKNEEGVIDITKAADSFIAGMFSMMKTIEETNVALAKQTGYATALQQDVLDLASSHDGLYLSMSESAEIVGSLSTGFKMYNAQSKQTRGEINDLAGRFKVLGVDTNTFATVLDQLNEGFGLTGAGALAAAAELENLAIRTGSPLSSVVNDFQDLGPQMSRFGSDGVRVFTKLNEQARTLGLTTRQAFDLSELFDTFESSADVAGKLNAQLGLQLNSVELMAASSEDRLKILRAEFDMEGMRFDQMGRRQRQMIADILQTDALTAEKLLGDPMAMREFQKEQENNAERVQKFTTAMDKFKAVAEQLFINLSPLLMGIMSVINKIAEGINWITSGPLGKMVSSFLVLGSIMIKFGATMGKVFGYVTSFVSKFPMLMKVLGFVGTVVKRLLVPFLIAKDVIQSIPGVGDEDSRSAARARLAGGLGGAAVGAIAGGGIGSVPAALIGYGVGREVTSFSNDKMETIKGSAVLKRSDGSMTRFAAGDTFTARKDGGDLSQLVKGMNQMVDLMKKSNDASQEIVLNVDSEPMARAVFRHTDPTMA